MLSQLTKAAPAMARVVPKRTFVRPTMPAKGGQHYVFEPKSGPSGANFDATTIGIAVAATVITGNCIIFGAARFQNWKHGFK